MFGRRAAGDNNRVKTLRLRVDPAHLKTPDAVEALECAAGILRAGGLVALPTETVYGLGANALDRESVLRIFRAKERPAWDPVIVHIAEAAMLEKLTAAVNERAHRLMEAFWPGPITLLLPRSAAVPDAVTAGRPLVGVRMPEHPVALELIRRAGLPVAAPSANRFGHTSPTTAEHVLHDLDGRIDAVVDAGSSLHGLESTVLDPNASPMVIYRPGAVTEEQIREVAGAVETFKPAGELMEQPPEALPSPGVGLRHYAPQARLVLLEGTVGELARGLADAAREWTGERVGVLLPEGIEPPDGALVYAWGRWDKPQELAQRLYAGLRALDATGCTVILCPLPGGAGIGAALRDRLRKAASSS